ncbi:hypothetical protein [Actinoplanes philippinensis]|uniref:hypothetical protein n=1 Tax=Actinoplanes philippinensis TaxID=35752 RepID=UPI0033E49FB5
MRLTAVDRAARQTARTRVAYTRSQIAGVIARAPPGARSGTSATCPSSGPAAVLRNTTCGSAATVVRSAAVSAVSRAAAVRSAYASAT